MDPRHAKHETIMPKHEQGPDTNQIFSSSEDISWKHSARAWAAAGGWEGSMQMDFVGFYKGLHKR